MPEILGTLEAPGGNRWPAGAANSIAVTDSRCYVRGPLGYYWTGHGAPALAGLVDLEAQKGVFTKVGDGFSILSNIGASQDGYRVVMGGKQDNISTVVFRNRWNDDHSGPNGRVLYQFGGARQLGGVAVAVKDGRYYGLALNGAGLWMCDITSPLPLKPGARQSSQIVPGAPGGAPGTLCAWGSTVAYLTTAGALVTYEPGGAPCVTPERATCLAIGPEGIALGTKDGVRWKGFDWALPGIPHAVAVLGDSAYAWIQVGGAQWLYWIGDEEGLAFRIFTMPPGHGTVVDCKASSANGPRLYCATTANVVVIGL